MDPRFGAASVLMQAQYRTVVVKKELCRKVKLLIYRSVYVPTLTYSHELQIVTERTRSQIKAAIMKFLWRVAGLSLKDSVRSLGVVHTAGLLRYDFFFFGCPHYN